MSVYGDNENYDGKDISFEDFASLSLIKSSWKNSIAIGTNYTNSTLTDANFTSATLTLAEFTDAIIDNTNFSHTKDFIREQLYSS